MTAAEIIWDILELKHAIEDDSDVDELWLLQKVNAYRAILIQQEYALLNRINPSWIQRLHKFSLTKVTAADDPSITLSSVWLSKGQLPSVVDLPDDMGLYRISGSSAITQFEPCDFNTLMMRIEIGEEMNSHYGYYSRIHNDVYLYPLCMEASALLIAENPLDIQVHEYGVLRARTLEDEYPVDIAMAQKIIIEICTKDFQISEGTIPDIINDSQKEFKILRSEGK